MGLDGFELLLEVEDHFGITIRDAEAQKVRTVGDLFALIQARVANTQSTGCPYLPAFLGVRRTMRDFLRNPQFRLRPSTTVKSVIPRHRRAEFWIALTELLESTPPPLRYPAPLRYTLVATSLLILALGGSTARIDSAILPLGLLGAVGAIIVLVLATAPLRTEPPTSLATFGDVTRRLVGLSVATQPIANEREVFESLRSLIVNQLGVRPEQVIPEARFIQDLGLD